MAAVVVLVIAGAVIAAFAVLWLIGERGRLLRPSTRRLFREGAGLHGYVYGRWTGQYVDALLNRLPANEKGGRWLAERYHGKVLTHANARAIVEINRDIPLRDLEQVVPYPTARNLVLKGPPDVVAYECACRHARAERCTPTQVCMVIGQPFTDFILEHNPDTARRLSQAEALELLDAERVRGHVHTAWFKDALAGRFYAICNCCKCCCGGIRMTTQRGLPMLAASGYVAELNEDLCDRCGECVETCPFGALAMGDTQVERDWDCCMGCGACEAKCPSEAVRLVRDARKGIPMDVRAMV